MTEAQHKVMHLLRDGRNVLFIMYDHDILNLQCDKALFLNVQTQCRIAISIFSLLCHQ